MVVDHRLSTITALKKSSVCGVINRLLASSSLTSWNSFGARASASSRVVCLTAIRYMLQSKSGDFASFDKSTLVDVSGGIRIHLP